MKIAPIDIAHKTFGRKMMGLDPDEVKEFLRNVADEFEAVVRERNSLREALREKELSIMEYRERDEVLKNTITTATKMSEKVREDAEREAKIVIGDAEQRAEVIVRDARDSLKKTYSEISELKRLKAQFESQLKAMLEAHINLIDQSGLVTRPITTPNFKNSKPATETTERKDLRAQTPPPMAQRQVPPTV